MSAPVTATGATDATSAQTGAGTSDATDSVTGSSVDTSVENFDARQLDMPGQIDPSRARAAYSGAENQNAHVRGLLAPSQYAYDLQLKLDEENMRIREENRAKASAREDQALRFRDQYHAQYMSAQQLLNVAIMNALLAALNSSQDNTNLSSAAFGELVDKIAGTAPPVTVSSPSGS